ncbi:TPA: hypothetical protein WIA67_001636, partial [Neisseria meningitidis]
MCLGFASLPTARRLTAIPEQIGGDTPEMPTLHAGRFVFETARGTYDIQKQRRRAGHPHFRRHLFVLDDQRE